MPSTIARSALGMTLSRDCPLTRLSIVIIPREASRFQAKTTSLAAIRAYSSANPALEAGSVSLTNFSNTASGMLAMDCQRDEESRESPKSLREVVARCDRFFGCPPLSSIIPASIAPRSRAQRSNVHGPAGGPNQGGYPAASSASVAESRRASAVLDGDRRRGISPTDQHRKNCDQSTRLHELLHEISLGDRLYTYDRCRNGSSQQTRLAYL